LLFIISHAPLYPNSLTSWVNSRGMIKTYPGDFDGILSTVEVFQCPNRGKRVMISNGIPDHEVTLQNRNAPCEINWVVEVSILKHRSFLTDQN
jgi:hypothetical protein